MVPDGRKATILVVEDDLALRTFYRSALMIAGYAVITAQDGIEALRWIEGATPDLVVLDIGLPRLGGRDVLEELKAHADTRRIPIMVVTAAEIHDLPSDAVACVMQKPVTAEQFITAVENCLRSLGMFFATIGVGLV